MSLIPFEEVIVMIMLIAMMMMVMVMMKDVSHYAINGVHERGIQRM